uniref:Uncharacterized protein n=1 Tax=viral metagenome TaxID=1070528 RepID=A0A6C0CKG1_9ZZZZ
MNVINVKTGEKYEFDTHGECSDKTHRKYFFRKFAITPTIYNTLIESYFNDCHVNYNVLKLITVKDLIYYSKYHGNVVTHITIKKNLNRIYRIHFCN